MASKQASVFIIDINKSMTNNDDNGISSAEKAHRIVSQLLQKKIISGRKTDVVGVIFVGSKETKNHLADDETYQQVSIYGYEDELPPLIMTDINLFRHVYHASEEGSCLADVSDGMIIAFDMLLSHCKHYKFQKHIYLLTDAANPIDDDCFESLKTKSGESEVKWSLIGFDFDDLEGEEGDQIEGSGNKSQVKKENERALYKFVNDLEGQFFQGDEALEMMEQLQKKAVNPTTSFRGNLVLGDAEKDNLHSIAIPIYLYAKTMEVKVPTSKKWSNIADSLPDAEVDPESITFGQVGTETTFKIKPNENETNDDDEDLLEADEIVDKEKLTKAYRYGKSHVIFGEDDQELIKLETDKSFKVLGFIPLTKVKREQYMDRIYAVAPDPNSKKAAAQLYALMAALHEKQCAAVARYCRIANAAPVVGAIVSNKKGYGYFIPMPFLEDVRHYSFPSFQYLTNSVDGSSSRTLGSSALSVNSSMVNTSFKRSMNTFESTSTNTRSLKRSKLHTRQGTPEEAFQVIDALIDSLDLMEADDGEEAYQSKFILNPAFQHMWRCISDRAVNPNSTTLPAIDERVIAGFKPLQSLVEKSENAIKELTKTFNVSKPIPKEKRRKRNLQTGAAVTVATETGLLARLGEEDFFGDAGTSRAVTSISTMDPSGDFEVMVQNPNSIDIAFEEMSQVIPKLLNESVGSQLYTKTFSALETFRAHALRLVKPTPFNEFLKDLKESLLAGDLKRQNAFWNEVILVKSLTLIKNSECADGVPDTEAEKFLTTAAENVSAPAQEAPEQPAEDDLLDMLD